MRSLDWKQIPTYFGWFIVIAMFPQIVGFNGTAIDTAFKLLLILGLTLMMYRKSNPFTVSRYCGFFIYISILDLSGIIVTNEVSIVSEVTSVMMGILLLYVLYESILMESEINVEDVLKFYKIIVYFLLAASVYNMIVHFNSLLHLTSLTVYNTEGICSIFDNKNTYGVFLIFGTLAATILKIILKQQRWSLIALVFVVNEMMAMCRTAILLSLIMIAISFFVDNRQRMQGIFVLLLVLGFAFILLRYNESLRNYVFNNLFGNSDSLDARNNYVDNMLPLARGVHLLFGYGNSNASVLAVQYAGNAYYHNTYLKNLISGGALKEILQVSAILLSVNYGFKCRFFDRTIGNLCILSTVVYTIYAYIESVVLFDSPIVAIMAVMFILSMPVLLYNALSTNDDV